MKPNLLIFTVLVAGLVARPIEYSNAQAANAQAANGELVSPIDLKNAPVQIAPEARELLRQMSAAYSGLRSFSCEVKSQRSFGKASVRNTARVQWQRRGSVAVEHFEKFSASPRLIRKRLLVDQGHVFTDYQGRGAYKGTLYGGRDSSRLLVDSLSSVTAFLDDKNWLQTLLNQNRRMSPQARIQSVEYGGAAKIGGATFDRVDCKFSGGAFSLYLDRRTHLVRRTTSKNAGDSMGNEAGGGVTDYLKVQLDPKIAPTVFQLPRGATVNGVAPAVAMREMRAEKRLKLPRFSDVKVVPRIEVKMKDVWLDSPQMIVLGQPQVFDNVRVQTVIIGENSEDEKGRATRYITTLLIGERDHLLRLYERQDNVSWREYGFIQRFRQTLTRVKAHQKLPASLFRFAPPSGARLVKARFPLTTRILLREGHKAPNVRATDLSGAAFSTQQYRGRVLLLDFWATSCSPCVEELPQIWAIYQKYHSQGFDVVGVAHDESKIELTSFLQKHDLPWRQIFALDERFATSTAFGAGGLPSTVLIGRNGEIVATNLRGSDMEAAIQAALKS